jgi:hypothetical protein
MVGSPEGHPVPAGVLIFDGAGTVRHLPSVEAGALPGPVYPASLARAQRRASAGETGYGVAEGGLDAENRASGGWDFVMPLTAPGSSEVVATGIIAADHVTDGQLNPYVIYATG